MTWGSSFQVVWFSLTFTVNTLYPCYPFLGTHYASDGHLIFGHGKNYAYYGTFVVDEFAFWEEELSDSDLQIMIEHFLNLRP